MAFVGRVVGRFRCMRATVQPLHRLYVVCNWRRENRIVRQEEGAGGRGVSCSALLEVELSEKGWIGDEEEGTRGGLDAKSTGYSAHPKVVLLKLDLVDNFDTRRIESGEVVERVQSRA